MKNLELHHELLMEEEGIKVSDLPIELQKKIKGFNLMKNKFDKNPDNQKLFIHLQKLATNIGDKIQDFIEDEYEDEDEETFDDDKESKKNEDSNSDSKSDKNHVSDKKDKSDNDKETNKEQKQERQDKKQNGKFGNFMMEKKILSIMEARGEKRIRISDLEAIIGCEPDYPEQQVYNLKLRKVFLSNDYRLI